MFHIFVVDYVSVSSYHIFRILDVMETFSKNVKHITSTYSQPQCIATFLIISLYVQNLVHFVWEISYLLRDIQICWHLQNKDLGTFHLKKAGMVSAVLPLYSYKAKHEAIVKQRWPWPVRLPG